MSIDNLYLHADGGYYCLLSDDAALKNPGGEGAWIDAVIYTGVDQKMRSTTKVRWEARFEPVAEYTGDDEAVMSMIRRCNPGNTDFDFIRVFESWHESEMNITASMLELAVAATVEQFTWSDRPSGRKNIIFEGKRPAVVELTIKTEDLQRVLQNYEITKTAIPHGFTFAIRKSFPEKA